jgi:hypothetical protein
VAINEAKGENNSEVQEDKNHDVRVEEDREVQMDGTRKCERCGADAHFAVLLLPHFYSLFNATFGSTFAARRAGR